MVILCAPFQKQATGQDYVIGPRDILKITVWGHQDLSQNYNVSAEGTIVFPLIGEVRAAGLTEGQLGQKLATVLEKDYLVNPRCSSLFSSIGARGCWSWARWTRPGRIR